MTASQTLTRKQLRELEAELLAERARLERSLESQSPGAAATTDVAPRLRAREEGGVALALATRTQARYAEILDALTRLAAGAYGACASCNGPIPYGRLLVMPEATRCVTCSPRL